MTFLFTDSELVGRARTHIVDVPQPRCSLHRDVVAPFLAMRQAAAAAGIDLVPVSSFRDFDRQLAIWNAKATGQRELLDPDGQPLDAAALDEDTRVAAILHWSALPGASRHHWGTDFDVMDAAALPPGYRLRMITDEYAPDGIFARLTAWLDEHAEGFGFFRPYTCWRGGVQPEPWHLSYAPVADAALAQFSAQALREAVLAAPVEGRDVIARQLPQIFDRYVRNVDPPPAAALSARGRMRA